MQRAYLVLGQRCVSEAQGLQYVLPCVALCNDHECRPHACLFITSIYTACSSLPSTLCHPLQELWRLRLDKGGRVLFEVATEYDEEAQYYAEMIRLWVSEESVSVA